MSLEITDDIPATVPPTRIDIVTDRFRSTTDAGHKLLIALMIKRPHQEDKLVAIVDDGNIWTGTYADVSGRYDAHYPSGVDLRPVGGKDVRA